MSILALNDIFADQDRTMSLAYNKQWKVKKNNNPKIRRWIYRYSGGLPINIYYLKNSNWVYHPVLRTLVFGEENWFDILIKINSKFAWCIHVFDNIIKLCSNFCFKKFNFDSYMDKCFSKVKPCRQSSYDHMLLLCKWNLYGIL